MELTTVICKCTEIIKLSAEAQENGLFNITEEYRKRMDELLESMDNATDAFCSFEASYHQLMHKVDNPVDRGD